MKSPVENRAEENLDLSRATRGFMSVLAAVLISITLIFALLHHTIFAYGNFPLDPLAPMFNLDQEANLPSWYSGCLWFMIGLSAFYAYINENRFLKQLQYRWWWLVISFAFFVASADEVTEIHERLGEWLLTELSSTSFGRAVGESIPFSPWLAFYLPPIALLAVVSLVFLFARFKHYFALFLWFIAGAACFIIALGNEFFQALPYSVCDPISAALGTSTSLLNNASVFIEETFEMLGCNCILIAFAGYCHELIESQIAWRAKKILDTLCGN